VLPPQLEALVLEYLHHVSVIVWLRRLWITASFIAYVGILISLAGLAFRWWPLPHTTALVTFSFIAGAALRIIAESAAHQTIQRARRVAALIAERMPADEIPLLLLIPPQMLRLWWRRRRARLL